MRLTCLCFSSSSYAHSRPVHERRRRQRHRCIRDSFNKLKVRRKAAEGWLKLHDEDPDHHYCLGCLYELSNEPNMARESFTRSVELGGSLKGHEKLGLLLAHNGEFESSAQHLKLALSLD